MPLLDSELMYVRLNPRTHTVFGLGKIEVAFETISQFLQAHRYAGRLAANSVVQYALWMQDRTPEQHERLIQWWQDEVEGTGRVMIRKVQSGHELLATRTSRSPTWIRVARLVNSNTLGLYPLSWLCQMDPN